MNLLDIQRHFSRSRTGYLRRTGTQSDWTGAYLIWCNQMDTPVEKCVEKVEEFEGIWCNEMDTQVDKCIERVTEFKWIGCDEMVTQAANCIEDEAEVPLVVPGGTRIFAMPCSWLHVNVMCSA